jgi:hypothetical protein
MLRRFGCPSLEDVHHLFVLCPFFQHFRDEYSVTLMADTRRLLSDSSLPPDMVSHVTRVASHLFRDHSSWPLHSSRFHLGLLPPLLPTRTSSLPIESQRCLTRLANTLHLSAIRLAGRIWGAILRHHLAMPKHAAHNPKKPRTRQTVLQNSNLTLPSHLSYLLHL